MDTVVRVRSVAWIATAIILSVFATLLVMQEWRADAAPGDSDSTFVPVTPCRLFDTRPAPFNVGAKDTPLGAGDSNRWTQPVRGVNGDCSIPSDAVGISMNVTIVNPTHQSNLRVFPADVPTPNASNLNWLAGQSPTPNKVDVKLSPDGEIKLYNFNGSVNVLADVVGYYTNASLKEIDMRLEALEMISPLVACDKGTVRAYAQVPGDVSSSFTDVSGYNCTGGTVEAKRISAGKYDVRFEDLPTDSTTAGMVVQVTAVGGNSGGTIVGYGTTASDDIRVDTYDNTGTRTDKLFSITLIDPGVTP
jgi:hypothetical protein